MTTVGGMAHSDFYVVGATVIPVLFLASELQLTFWRRYARFGVPKNMSGGEQWKTAGRTFTAVAAVVVVAVALIGEWTAIQALRYLVDSPGRRSWVAAGLGTLLVVNVVGLGMQLWIDIRKEPSEEAIRPDNTP